MENPHAPRSDPHRDISHFLRSSEQDHALGLYTAEEIAAAEGIEANSEAAVTTNGATAVEVLQAPTASAEDSTSSTTSSTLLLRCQVKNFLCVAFNKKKGLWPAKIKPSHGEWVCFKDCQNILSSILKTGA